MPGNGGALWIAHRHRHETRLDYRRFVVMGLAEQVGIGEDTAFYHTRLRGWDTKKSQTCRGTPTRLSINQFFCLVACTEWRDLTVEQAKQLAKMAGLPTDGESRILEAKEGREPTAWSPQGRVVLARSGGVKWLQGIDTIGHG